MAPPVSYRLKIPKDYRADVRRLMEAGWTLTHTGRHPKLTCPAGCHAIPVPTSGSSRGLRKGWGRQVRRHDEGCSGP